MRILIDECVDQRVRLLLPGYDCETAGYAGLAGLKNGALLAAAEKMGFHVMVTTDQETSFQQNLSLRQIGILVLCGSTNRLSDLRRLLPKALRALARIQPGEVIRID